MPQMLSGDLLWLDSPTLQSQLIELEYETALREILSPAVYALCAAASPQAPPDSVGRVLEATLASVALQRAAQEVAEAREALAQAFNDRNVAALDRALLAHREAFARQQQHEELADEGD